MTRCEVHGHDEDRFRNDAAGRPAPRSTANAKGDQTHPTNPQGRNP